MPVKKALQKKDFTLIMSEGGAYKKCPTCGKAIKIDISAPLERCPECGSNMEKEEA